MFKKILWKARTFVALSLVTTVVVGGLTGCGRSDEASSKSLSDQSAQKEPVTLKVLSSGEEPNDWDRILEEFYARTKDTLNITFDWTWVPITDYKDKMNVKMTTGEEYDLVFDAPWLHLRILAEEGIYADLSSYLNNDEYPGLKKCFPEYIMKYNQYSGISCALPMIFSYVEVDIVMYRMDWAKEFGIGTNGQINSHDELRQYLQSVKDHKEGVVPITLKANRGFFHLFEAITVEQQKEHIYQGTLGKDIFFAIKLNDAENKVIATALPGDSAEYWEPFGGVDFWKQKLEKSREWNQYCETDSLNQTESEAMFQIGEAAACIDKIDAVPKFNQLLEENVPGAQLGVYIQEEQMRNFEKGVYSAKVTADNCLCIPANSKNIERTVEFLNWLFESQENHDLFEYGIEGVHWEKVGDKQYKLPEGVEAADNYNPNGWNLTWTPEYYRFSSDYVEYSIPYVEWATELDNFTISGVTGFSFESDSVKAEVAQCGAILGEVLVPLNHGILDNPYQVMQETAALMRDNNVQVGIDEYVRQLNEFLANK